MLKNNQEVRDVSGKDRTIFRRKGRGADRQVVQGAIALVGLSTIMSVPTNGHYLLPHAHKKRRPT